MKYKIQVDSFGGWSDLKTCTNDGTDCSDYIVEEFDSFEEAEAELKTIIKELQDDEENYRIATTDVVEECNIYEE